jgi:hypothetical protein
MFMHVRQPARQRARQRRRPSLTDGPWLAFGVAAVICVGGRKDASGRAPVRGYVRAKIEAGLKAYFQ